MTRLTIALFTCCMLLAFTSFGQKKDKKSHGEQTIELQDTFDATLLNAMQWRCIGPFRGGRSTTVCGVIQNPETYYFGSAGGGVWKTTDGGYRWRNISDGHMKTGSVGAIAVAPSDPNVIYVGMGEAPIRGVMTSTGDGLYKSTDAGVTWSHIGLDNTMQISQIRVHPNKPDVVFVAAQGNPYGPSEDRGVYRSTDGGVTWSKIHYVDENTGASDLSIDIRNPRVLYAAYWDHTRLPWYMRSGGEGSGIWKSSDSGENWVLLTEGFPDSIMGKIGISVSPASSNTVYAIIESEQGGLYRSDDAGKSWALINDDRVLRARSWYYMHVFADPEDVNTVHIMNAPYMRSTDGGKTFTRIATPHGDNHALWINPVNASIMINGNDGGANVSFDGGRTWSTQNNQPTAQFYRVNADNQFPYRVYGGQQDNSSVSILSGTDGRGIANSDFHSVGGCESAYCAFDPDDPRYIYAGCIQGVITEYDSKLKSSKDIMVYTDLGLGKNPKDMKYRFNWNAPILMSKHNTDVIYHCGNVVLRSEDRGLSWTEISPDLSKNIAAHIDWGGGPITNEGAGGENYHTIMYLAESPTDANELWVGTDDGLVQITRDGGVSWSDITPSGIEEGIVNAIDLSVHNPGTAYVAFTRYKFGDFTPYVYITTDYGQTWHNATKGIEDMCHVRVVREDDEVAGLLYAGTERGMFMSWNKGDQWQRVQLNLPIVPITDIKVHHGDLVISTQGRAFWILDDLTPVRNWQSIDKEMFASLPSRDAFLWGGERNDDLRDMGANPDPGIVTYFYSPVADTNVSILIIDQSGKTVREFSTDAKEKGNKLKVSKGLNKHVWNMRRDDLKSLKGLMTFGGTGGTLVGPGTYKVNIFYGENNPESFTVTISDDPRSDISAKAHLEKQGLLNSLYNATQVVFDEVKNIRYVSRQIESFQERHGATADSVLFDKGQRIIATLDSLEKTIVQAKQKTRQDVVNFPSQIDGQLMHIQGVIDRSYPPLTQGQKDRANDIMNSWDEKRAFLNAYLSTELEEFNNLIRERDIPFIAPSAPEVAKKKSKS
jgi:photosystem II stability/assembly factor-like uncharacterized protein